MELELSLTAATNRVSVEVSPIIESVRSQASQGARLKLPYPPARQPAAFTDFVEVVRPLTNPEPQPQHTLFVVSQLPKGLIHRALHPVRHSWRARALEPVRHARGKRRLPNSARCHGVPIVPCHHRPPYGLSPLCTRSVKLCIRNSTEFTRNTPSISHFHLG